jgi:hypothetical protein
MCSARAGIQAVAPSCICAGQGSCQARADSVNLLSVLAPQLCVLVAAAPVSDAMVEFALAAWVQGRKRKLLPSMYAGAAGAAGQAGRQQQAGRWCRRSWGRSQEKSKQDQLRRIGAATCAAAMAHGRSGSGAGSSSLGTDWGVQAQIWAVWIVKAKGCNVLGVDASQTIKSTNGIISTTVLYI